MIKSTNPAVIIASNWSPERVYHKALEKDPSALDSLLTRVEIVEITEPLDIDGFKEAIAQASAATTVTPTTSVLVEDLSVTTSPRVEELAASSSTIDQSPSNSPRTESPISTPPVRHLSPPPSTSKSKEYEINEEELIPCQEEEVQREETAYEKFMRERREKIQRKQRKEDAFSRLERKGKNILFTGYNE